MTNEETLKLLKPIMLDGTEKSGDKVYSLRHGDTSIENILPSQHTLYPIVVNGYGYSQYGYLSTDNVVPSLFKVNPFEWLASQNNNQERVIEVMSMGGAWIPRVLIKILDGHAVIWRNATTIEEAKSQWLTEIIKEWRELPTKITKEEALKMCEGKGVDMTGVLKHHLEAMGVDTTNLIIE